jgi:CHAT domain-containing protein
VSDAAARARLDAEVELAEVEVGARRDPVAAIARIGSVLETFAASGDRFRTARARELRAEAYDALDDLPSASADYAACAAELEAERAAAPEERLQVSVLAEREPVFDRAARFSYLRQGSAERALWFSEVRRARTLLAKLGPPRDAVAAWLAGSGSLDAVQAGIPPGAAVVEYCLAGDVAFAWTITRDAVTATLLPERGDVLERRALAYRAAVEGQASFDELARASGPLYAALVAPLEASLHGCQWVVLVPDKTLAHLPFAALIDPATGRFAAETYELVTSPSLAVYVRCAARDAALARRRTGGALVIGNPRFSTARFAGLDDLPGAEVEAREVASSWPGARVLTGALATRSEFLRRAPDAGIVHFAGHMVADGDGDGGPALVCAEERADASDLARACVGEADVATLRLTQTRLVVLAACGSAEVGARSEGTAGLVRPFLAAGAPVVVGSLWAVDDRATLPLFAEFHRLVSHGANPATALAHAQRARIASDDPDARQPRHWAAFAVFGGFARIDH